MLKKILIIVLVLFTTSYSYAEFYTVEKIIDGDTVRIKRCYISYNVRLAGIDCPELSQPFGKKAKDYLSQILNKTVYVKGFNKTDRYNRPIVVLYLKKTNINKVMLFEGLAEVYPGRFPGIDKIRYLEIQADAKKKKKGIWGLKEYISPGKWRKRLTKGAKE